MNTNSLKTILTLAFLLTLTGGIVNCSGKVADVQDAPTEQGQQPSPGPQPGPSPQPAPSSTCTDAGLTDLESRMRTALQNTVTDHSFYLELRRPSLDSRTFTFNRNIDGIVDASSTMSSASTAKMISASVIMDVVANPQLYPGAGIVNGKALTLDSLARDFLPDGSGGTYWRTNAGALPTTSRLYGVTLRHLLSFTSGIELENALGGPECIGAPEATFTHGGCVRNLVTVNLARNLNSAEPRTFFYNGAHLSIAALMAVKAAGVANWAELFKRYKSAHGVFSTPLVPASPANVIAAGGPGAFYPFSDGNSSPSVAGAMRYRAGDYAPFMVKLQAGAILPSVILSQMFSDQMTAVNATIEYSPMLNDSPSEEWHYGLGLWNECHAAVWSLACITPRYSSPGSFGSYPFMDLNLSGGISYPLIGYVGRGGTDQGTGMKGVLIYRSLAVSADPSAKDLAQQWAANICQ